MGGKERKENVGRGRSLFELIRKTCHLFSDRAPIRARGAGPPSSEVQAARTTFPQLFLPTTSALPSDGSSEVCAVIIQIVMGLQQPP